MPGGSSPKRASNSPDKSGLSSLQGVPNGNDNHLTFIETVTNDITACAKTHGNLARLRDTEFNVDCDARAP